MNASEVAAIVVAAVSLVVVIGLLVALTALVRTLSHMRLAIEDLRQNTLPVMSDMQGTVRRVAGELERVDSLLDTAESISTTVDSASRVAYLAFSNPVIKAMAFATGTSRAMRRFRRERER